MKHHQDIDTKKIRDFAMSSKIEQQKKYKSILKGETHLLYTRKEVISHHEP
jgi:hypothetical protein